MIRVKALATVQMLAGGGKVRDHRVHLVRMTDQGTPGDTLCGIERFGPSGAGWSVGGGVKGPAVERSACSGCVDVAGRFYAAAPVWGSTHADLFPRMARAPWSVTNLPVVTTEL
ncbi:hypothetical protein SEA_REDFOX_58 [Arthrobacter phage RedFox]|nr:hypothetical protein SEA_REDFOX_58 [Arthrobacter phage RedFox]